MGLRAHGVDLTAMVAPGARFNEAFRAAGVPLIERDFKGRRDSDGQAAVRSVLSQGDFDIVHAFNNRAVANSLAACRGLNVRFIAYRGIEGNDSYYNPGSWSTYLNPRVDRVVCVAEAIRQHFLRISLLGWRQPADKFVTIYKGHDLSWYQQAPADLSEWGIPKGAFVVSSVANERPRKGLPVLIRALGDLAEYDNVHLLLIGHIKSRATLDAIAQSPMAKRIHLTGYRADAPALVAATDVYVLPSLRREGLPKTVIEAMAYGVAPIVTDSGGSPELIVHGESGLIVPSGDAKAISQAIKGLLFDRNYRDRLGQAAQQRLGEAFPIEETIEQTLRVYRDVLQKP